MLAFLEPWAERRICFAAFGAHQDFPAAHMNMSSISKFRGKQGYVGPKTGLSFCTVSRLLRTDKVTFCCPFAPKIQAGTQKVKTAGDEPRIPSGPSSKVTFEAGVG